MYMSFLIMNIMLTIMFLYLNHPLSMGMMLLLQTIIISINSGMMFMSFWFSYILFLIMLGGMLVLFIYMTSLASNEMFSLSIKLTLMFTIMMTISIYMMMFNDHMLINFMFKNSNMIELYNNLMILKNENIKTLNMIYNNPNNLITMMLINYLFLTLIAVVKITDINYGPLRQKNYE